MMKREEEAAFQGNYELVSKLGEGTFGEVWLARDRKLNENVALKYLRLELADQETIDLFKGEFEILTQLKHAHLAQVHDFGFLPDQRQYYFTSEYCTGTTFIQAADGKPYEYIEEMLAQVLTALDYVHSQGIVHFDIKSDNILVADVGGHPQVKILDFGVAAKLKSISQTVAVGTPTYMAPELLIEGETVDHRADLYSVGMLLLRTFTGRFPFSVENTEDVYDWHVRGSLPEEIWEGVSIPRHMHDIIKKLLAKNPAERFSNARVALHFLNVATGKKYLSAEESLAVRIPREGPLVEREEIIAELKKRLDAAFSPGAAPEFGQSAVISGAQGMGKSRLVNEMRHAVELREVSFLEIVCEWQAPEWPKIESWLGLADRIPAEMSEDWQIRMRVDAIIEAAQRKPLCMLLDDFHKADRSTKNLLSQLLEKLERYRRDGRTVPIFLLTATEETLEGALTMTRLTAAGIAQYINLVLGETERTEAIATLLHQYSGGLPLLMVEGLRFLAPHLSKDEPIENLLPPPQIGLLYKERMDALSPEESDLLAELALIFRPIEMRSLAETLGEGHAQLVRLLERCQREELVVSIPAPDPARTLVQVSSQALALDIIRSLDPERGMRLSGVIAEGLSKIEGVPRNEIAYHTAKAGNVDKAIRIYEQASDEYKERHQIGPAADSITRAIAICPQTSASWPELLEKAANLLMVTGSLREAQHYLEKLEGRVTPSLEELRGLIALQTRQFDDAKAHYSRSLELTPKDRRFDRVLAENYIGISELQSGRLEEAVKIFLRTREEAAALPAEERSKVTNNSLGIALAFLGRTDEALAYDLKDLDRLEPGRNINRIALESEIGYVLMRASRYEEAIPHLRNSMELAEKSGVMHALFSTTGNLVGALLKEASYAEALEVLRRMGAYQERFGSVHDLIYNLLREGSVYLLLGMDEAAAANFTKGRRLSQEEGEQALQPWFALMLSYIERERGNREKAEELLRIAEAEGLERGDADLVAWARYTDADMAFEFEDPVGARARFERLTTELNDGEFKLRVELLRAILDETSTLDELQARFTSLETACLAGQLKELTWEVYYGWAHAELARGNRAQGILLLIKGVEVIDELAAALPEEYRDRYRGTRARRRLIEDLKKLTKASEGPKEEKPRGAYAAKPGIEGAAAERTPTYPPADSTIGRKPSTSEKTAADKTLGRPGKPEAEKTDDKPVEPDEPTQKE